MSGEALGRLIAPVLFALLVMALVAGVYYLRARPRLTFRQALFRWWVAAIGAVALLLSICGLIAQAA